MFYILLNASSSDLSLVPVTETVWMW